MNTQSHASRQVAILGILLPLLLRYPVASFGQEQTIRFTQLPREIIEGRLRRVARNNDEREANLREMFMSAGCDGESLSEQPIKGMKQKNLICTLQGSTPSVIIIGAHVDHAESYGMGVVDNWSGASLLPSLFESLKTHALKHTLRFIGFALEERGLVGSAFYAKQLTPEEVDKVRLMINLDSLGLSGTKVWRTHSDDKMTTILAGVAKALHLPLEIVNADLCCDEDSTPFRKRHVSTLMLHSLTSQTFAILHSSNDNISQIRMDDYYDSYRLIDAYAAQMDRLLD